MPSTARMALALSALTMMRFEEIADYVMTHAKENDLILTLGGGDIYKCANLIVEKYKERA